MFQLETREARYVGRQALLQQEVALVAAAGGARVCAPKPKTTLFVAAIGCAAVSGSCGGGGTRTYECAQASKRVVRGINLWCSRQRILCSPFGLYAPRVFASGSSVYYFNKVTIKQDCEKMRISKRDLCDFMKKELEQGGTQPKIGLTMRVYYTMCSAVRGVVSKIECNIRNYVLCSDTSDKRANAGFKLRTWGITTVGFAGVIGTVLFFGVIVILVNARS